MCIHRYEHCISMYQHFNESVFVSSYLKEYRCRACPKKGTLSPRIQNKQTLSYHDRFPSSIQEIIFYIKKEPTLVGSFRCFSLFTCSDRLRMSPDPLLLFWSLRNTAAPYGLDGSNVETRDGALALLSLRNLLKYRRI